MRALKIAVGLLMVGILGACATTSLSKDECTTADWQLIGHEDGASGKSITRLGSHRKACAKHGITPDQARYSQGYQEGLTLFCTDQRGLTDGKQGRNAKTVCGEFPGYQSAYEDGLGLFCTESRGFEQGQRGHSAHANCETYTAYQDAYDQGFINYCGTEGLRDGENGEYPREICLSEPAYEEAYEEGLTYFCTSERGFTDGKEGLEAYEVCETKTLYINAYNRGLRGYCSYRNGYRLGLANTSYKSTCPITLEKNFLKGYDTGKRVNELNISYDRLINKLSALEQKHITNDKKIDDLKNRLQYDKSLNAQGKNALYEQLERQRSVSDKLDREQDNIEAELRNIKTTLRRLKL